MSRDVYRAPEHRKARAGSIRGRLFPPMSEPTLEGLRSATIEDAETGCWIWQRYVGGNGGYGGIKSQGVQWMAHRLSWTLVNGPIPDGLTVDHLCFRPTCINPEHLRLLTASENAAFNTRRLKTHCKHGHEFTPENTILSPGAGDYMRRACRICRRESQRRYEAKRYAA